MKYFAMLNGEQKGPYSLEELPSAGVYPETYVWCKGMEDWKKAEEVAEICRFYRQRLIGIPGERAESPEEIAKRKQSAELEERERILEGIVRYRRQIEDSGTDFSAVKEDESRYDRPPRFFIVESLLATMLCFPLTGFVGIYYSIRSSIAWKKGDKRASHEYSRSARMWIGITFFLGVILAGYMLLMKTGG